MSLSPLCFSLECLSSESAGKSMLLLTLLSRERKKIALSMKEWARTSHTPPLKKLMSLLFEDEFSFSLQAGRNREKEQERPLSSFRLRPSTAHARIQEASLLAPLFFREKQVRVDPFTSCALSCLISQKEGLFSCLAEARFSSLRIPLQETDILIGPPHFLSAHGILRPFHNEIDASLLRCAMKPSLTERDITFLQGCAQELPKEAFSLSMPLVATITQKPTLVPRLRFMDSQFLYAQLFFHYPSGSVYSYPLNQLAPVEQERVHAMEEKEARDLQDLGAVWKAKEKEWYLSPEKREEVLLFLLELGWHIEEHTGKKLQACKAFRMEPIPQTSHFVLEGEATFEGKTMPLQELYPSVSRSLLTVPLSENEAGFLGTSLFSPLRSLLGEVVIHGTTLHLPKNRLGLLQNAFPLVKEHMPQKRLCHERKAACPFKGELRPYQKEGVEWLQNLHARGFSAILADEMGLGKTVQLLSFLSCHKELLPTLIVAPKALLENWRREIHRFCPDLVVFLAQGTEDAKEIPLSDVVVASYTTVRLAFDSFQKTNWLLIVLDEAQYCKNDDTLIHEAIRSLGGSMKILLTGTPIENSLHDLAALFSLFDETLLGTPKELVSSLQARQGTEEETRFLQTVRKKVAPFLLKRTKKEVAHDLPPLLEEISFIELYEEERKRYDAFVHALKSGSLKKFSFSLENPSRVLILEGLLRMRQLVCHPLLFRAEYEQPLCSTSSAKWDTAFSDIIELLQEGKKVLFFSQFVEILGFFSKALRDADIPHFQIDGSTNDRQEIVDRFEQEKRPSVLLASLLASGVGLNITTADAVLLYDPWWNGAREQQALARAHRIGRKEPVYVKRYIASKTIEERVFHVRQKKDALIKAILDEEEAEGEEESISSLFFSELAEGD